MAKLAANALLGEKRCILFAGAGVSKDAAIPTSWELRLEIAKMLYISIKNPKERLEEWFPKSECSKMSYPDLMNEFYSKYPSQQDFLQEYLGNRNIGETHRGIAELVGHGIVRAIVTTNFDEYIEKALEEKGLKTQVISTDEDLNNSEPLIQCKFVRVYKPHGTLSRGALRNTPKDLEQLSPDMEKELIRVLSEHVVIVLGYSGQDKGIQKVFKERSCSYYPIFWVDPKHPEGEIENILKQKDYNYIQCERANQFINDFLSTIERLDALSPKTRSYYFKT